MRATYYAKEQIEISTASVKLIENLDKKISIEELAKGPMSKVTFQAIFKQIYGDTPMPYQKV